VRCLVLEYWWIWCDARYRSIQCNSRSPLILLLLEEEGSVSALEVVLVDDWELPLDAIESPRPGDLLEVGLADE
jgi:hypothetical protein